VGTAVIPFQPYMETMLLGSDQTVVVPTLALVAFAVAWGLTIGPRRRRRWSILLGAILLVVPVIDALWTITVHLGGAYVTPTGGWPISGNTVTSVFLLAVWWVAGGLCATGGQRDPGAARTEPSG
ncbi:MAG TPA: hypothetical protein VMH24_09235, partial [Candidatus Sulfotelmatobacter sp.]|nr:hypothetical protein [Candidatus Sulfotelmatobacter sp.]